MINLCTSNWQINDIDTVIFDKDGTFIDIHYFWGKMTEMRAGEIIKKFDLPASSLAKLCSFLGFDIKSQKMLKDGITAMYSRPKIIEIFKNNLQEFDINVSSDELSKIFDSVSLEFYKEMNKYTKPIDSAIEFIKKLHGIGIKMAVVTSDSLESTNLTLQHFGWEKYFSAVIGRESSKEPKESGIPVKMALELMNSSPLNTVMIGDAPMDYFAAINANVNSTILAATGQIEETDLKKVTNYTVKSLNSIQIKESKS